MRFASARHFGRKPDTDPKLSLALSTWFVSNLTSPSLHLKFGAWSKRSSASGYCLYSSVPPTIEHHPCWQQGMLLCLYYVKADLCMRSSLPNTDKQCLCDDSTLTASINTVILTISLLNKESTVAEIHKRLLNTVTHG